MAASSSGKLSSDGDGSEDDDLELSIDLRLGRRTFPLFGFQMGNRVGSRTSLASNSVYSTESDGG